VYPKAMIKQTDQTDIWDEKHSIAMGIALQTQVLKICPAHRQLYCDDDVDPAIAFAVAAQLIREDRQSAGVFRQDVHDLADLLTDVICAAQCVCTTCAPMLQDQRRASPRELAMAY
jgi:hypothetical protein